MECESCRYYSADLPADDERTSAWEQLKTGITSIHTQLSGQNTGGQERR